MEPGQLFLARSRSYFQQEYRIKLRAAVSALSSDALWWRPNEQSNGVGNLLLHLTGNLRQWIVGGVGGAANVRDRAAEFAAQSGPGAEELLGSLERTLDDVDAVLAGLSPADLSTVRTIQVPRRHGARRDLSHVVEHFALHLGQIHSRGQAAHARRRAFL